MKILVTGAVGWIGSYLVPELEFRGHKVVAVDREQGDLSLPGIAQSIIQSSEPDIVVHLAACPGRLLCEWSPLQAVDDNLNATILVARACAGFKTRLCYVSTSEVYSGCNRNRLFEDDAGSGSMRNIYSLTKWWGEQVSRLYAPEGLLILRPSMPYGPGQPVGVGRCALSTMIYNFLNDLPFTVHRNTARSWCYISDLVEAMATLIERTEGTFNVGRDDHLTIMSHLSVIVSTILDTSIELIKVSDPDNTITPVKDISMTRMRTFWWEPKVSLEEGIKRVAESFR